MTFRVDGTTVIDSSRNICNAVNVNATSVCATNFFGNGSGITGINATGGGEIVCGTSSYTLTCSNQRTVSICITSQPSSASVCLPNATTLSEGSPTYVIKNVNPSTSLILRDVCSCALGVISPCGSSIVSLVDNTTCQGTWTLGSFATPEGVQTVSEVTYAALGTCVVSFTDADQNFHLLTVDFPSCRACARTFKPTSSGYCVTGSVVCLCSCLQFYPFTTASCGWAFGQAFQCHSSACGNIGANCGVLYLINCDSTCTCCIIDNMKALCTSPTGNWWESVLAIPSSNCGGASNRLFGFFETNMSDSVTCSACAVRLWCINNCTTGVPTACFLYCCLAFQTTFSGRRCWSPSISGRVEFFNEGNTSSLCGKQIVVVHNSGPSCTARCIEMFCLSANGQFSRHHTGCGNTGACLIATYFASYSQNTFRNAFLWNCQLSGDSDHTNGGGYNIQKLWSFCTSGELLCLRDPLGSTLPGSAAEFNSGSVNIFPIGCCLVGTFVSMSNASCNFTGIYRLCATTPLVATLLCSYCLPSCCTSCNTALFYSCLFGLNCNWHSILGQCSYFVNNDHNLPKRKFERCGLTNYQICDTNACVVWWAPSGPDSCVCLRRWLFNAAANTISQDCVLCFCGYTITCATCLAGGAIVTGNSATRACVHFLGNASFAICLTCATNTINPIECSANNLFSCTTASSNSNYYCVGNCRFLFTSCSASGTPNYSVVLYDMNTFPQTVSILGCYNNKARSTPQNYNVNTCRFIAYMGCCSASGATNSEIVLGIIDPATCCLSYSTGISESAISRSIEAIDANGYSVVQSCNCNSPTYTKTYERLKLL